MKISAALGAARIKKDNWALSAMKITTQCIEIDIPGQCPEGHLVLYFKTEVGPPVQIQKTIAFLTKITVFNEKVLSIIYVQSD